MLSPRFICQSALVCLFVSLYLVPLAQVPSPREVIEKSIDFHDPHRIWGKENVAITLSEKRPNGTIRKSELQFDWSKPTFKLIQHIDSNQISYEVSHQDTLVYFNGSVPADSTLIRKFRLNKKRAVLLRDYYSYLYGLPMILTEDMESVQEVNDTIFNHHPAYSISLRYEPPVGNDTWYFYFDKSDYSLIGYQFYHDPSANDGEYIILKGMAQLGQLKLPRSRKWFVKKDDNFLGEDTITALK